MGLVDNLPTSAEELSSSARHTTEEMIRGMRALYTTAVSCSEMSLIQADGTCNLKSPQNESVTLDWRADPFVSLSDLTLVVYDGSGGVPYHVHTLLMAYGGRKSKFVLEQIKNKSSRVRKRVGGSQTTRLGGRTDSDSNSTSSGPQQQQQALNRQHSDSAEYQVDIYVPSLAARYMPLFLDYIYGSTLQLTTDNAPPLRYLSNRFDVRDLHREVNSRFITRDLEPGTAAKYCAMADELKDYELRDRSVKLLAERFDGVNISTLGKLNPRLMRSLVQSDRLRCGSVELSEKIARYLRLRDEMLEDADKAERIDGPNSEFLSPLTDEDYYWLTHCQHMPEISPKEALYYLSYGARFPQVMAEVGSGSLKARCLASSSKPEAMDALADHLEGNGPLELYEGLEPKLKVQLLESTVVGARRNVRRRDEDDKRRIDDERDAQLSDEIMYGANGELASTRRSRLIVMGCGIGPANGIYRSAGGDQAGGGSETGRRQQQQPQQQRSPTYEKEAVWNHNRVTFVVYVTASGRYYVQYRLAVRQGHGMRVLYNSPAVVDASGAAGGGAAPPPPPPEMGWEVEGDDSSLDHERMMEVGSPPKFVGRIELENAAAAGNSTSTNTAFRQMTV